MYLLILYIVICCLTTYTYYNAIDDIIRAYLSFTHIRSKINAFRVGNVFFYLFTTIVIVVEPVVLSGRKTNKTDTSMAHTHPHTHAHPCTHTHRHTFLVEWLTQLVGSQLLFSSQLQSVSCTWRKSFQSKHPPMEKHPYININMWLKPQYCI